MGNIMKDNDLVCIDCGTNYRYDPKNARGASADRCARCRKKETLRKRIFYLMGLASEKKPECRKCGYRKSVYGLSLIDGKTRIAKVTTPEQEETRAQQSFLLCKNCEAECTAGVFNVKVIDTEVTPIEVEFYETAVRIVESPITPHVSYSKDVSPVEIVTDETPDTIKRVRSLSPKSLPSPE